MLWMGVTQTSQHCTAGKRDHMCSHCAIQSFSTMWTRYNDHLQIISFPLKGKQCVILQHPDQPSVLNSRLQSEMAYTGLEKQREKLKRSLIALTEAPKARTIKGKKENTDEEHGYCITVSRECTFTHRSFDIAHD